MNKADKGLKNGSCNVTACQKTGAIYLNKSTRAYYCKSCADLINWPGGRADCMKLYGTPLLCELDVEEPMSNTDIDGILTAAKAFADEKIASGWKREDFANAFLRELGVEEKVTHTPEPWVWHENGEANSYYLLNSGKDWVIAFRQNGCLMEAKQQANADRIVACVNACEGIDTHILKGLSPKFFAQYPDKVLAERRTLEGECDRLRSALDSIKDYAKNYTYDSGLYDLVIETLAQFEGDPNVRITE